MTDPYGRTPAGLIQRIMQRLTSVESRLARGGALPDRLGADGLQVTDWNTATDVGFYWGSGASNQPSGATKWVGITQSADGGATLVQTLIRPDAPTAPVQTRTYSAGAWGAWGPASAGTTVQPGVIQPFGGATIPVGWLLCNGQAISRTTYAPLFAVIGTSYGIGDGSTTFNVPDMRGKVPVGLDGTSDFPTLGVSGGEKAHTLTTPEMPSHQHQQFYASNAISAGGGSSVGGMTSSGATGATAAQQYVAAVGGGGAHNNLQPYLTVNFIISTGYVAGSFNPSALPPRLDARGAQITDWNSATDAGFYWGDAAVTHAPYANRWDGVVSVGQDSRVDQELVNSLSPVKWMRSRKSVANEAYNSQPDPTVYGVGANGTQPRASAEWVGRWSWTATVPTSGAPNGGAFYRLTCPSSQDSSSRGWNLYDNVDFMSSVNQQSRMQPSMAGETITVSVYMRCSKAVTAYIMAANGDGAGNKLEAFAGPNVAIPANTWTLVSGTFTATRDGVWGFGAYLQGGVAFVSGDTLDGAQLQVTYPSGKWTLWRRSDNLLIPVRCIGGTSAAQVTRAIDMVTGRYNITAGDKYFAMDGIFTDEFRAYQMLFQWYTGDANGSGVRFRQNGVEIAPGTGYGYTGIYANGTTLAAIASTANQGSFPASSGNGFSGEVVITEPMSAVGNTNQKRMRAVWHHYGSPEGQTNISSSLGGYDTYHLDGFAIYLSSQGINGVAAGSTAWISVKGIA